MTSRYFCVYRFDTNAGDMTIRAGFLNDERHRKTGADHSKSSTTRQDWAINIIFDCNRQWAQRNYQTWYPLPQHPYIAALSHDGFYYTEYTIWVHSETYIEITVR